jgi:hypothetical protein
MVIPRKYRGGTVGGGSCLVFQCEQLATHESDRLRLYFPGTTVYLL